MKTTNNFSNRNALKMAFIGMACFAVAGFAWSGNSDKPVRVDGSTINEETVEASSNPTAARAAFTEAAKVFFSARCANCHPAGDVPTQGDEMTPHMQGVTRGKDGKGVYGQTCTTCHQAENVDGEHMPPGTPNWHMPPTDQKMVFQGLTAGQLCRQLKDPKKNGGRKTPKEAIHHLEADPLVTWAWAPGNGRTLPPMSYEDFMKNMNDWVKNGGACPE